MSDAAPDLDHAPDCPRERVERYVAAAPQVETFIGVTGRGETVTTSRQVGELPVDGHSLRRLRRDRLRRPPWFPWTLSISAPPLLPLGLD